ncbi:MAG TPA: matrixin family metalloprotease [Gemmatimonadaceae bacterium]|nr:matrixin family metalloprotease [Gemmatimonadaceae bacterium]
MSVIPLDTAPPVRATLPLQTACLADTTRHNDTIAPVAGSIAGKQATVRWPDRRNNPIRVWIQAAPQLPGWSIADRTLVETAFHAWDSAGLPLRFVFIPNGAGADVVVRWIDKFPVHHEGWTTMWWDRNGWIQNGDMVLALRSPAGHRLTPVELQAIATHEAGHVLGLAHTEDTTAVMSATVYAENLTRGDMAAAQRLYAEPPGRRAILAQAGGRSAAKIGHVTPCPSFRTTAPE